MKRDESIDVLRFIGLSFIILAHVHPPRWIFLLREFDIPLMVIVSALAFNQANSQEHYWDYVWKRVKQLVLPTWIFLSIFFAIVSIFKTGFNQTLTLDNVAGSYALIFGIGYVWIIRVMLLVALTAPFIYRLNRRITANSSYLLLLLAMYLIHELLIFESDHISYEVSLILYYGMAYSILFALGLRLPKLTILQRNIVFIIALCTFLILGISYYQVHGRIISLQIYKFPPSAYYLSYGVAISLILYSAKNYLLKLVSASTLLKTLVMFIGQHSLWIYLWHIGFVETIMRSYPGAPFFIKYLVVFSLSTTMVYIFCSLRKRN